MSSINEIGVLPESELFFFTPSEMAQSLLYYITRCGHYRCSGQYAFSSQSELGSAAGRMTFLLFYVISGSLQLEVDHRLYTIGPDQIALIDCRQPHEYRALESVEFLWVHFDGANARQFFDQILTTRGKPIFTTPDKSDLHHDILKLIACSYKVRGLPEIEHSLTLYKVLCALLSTAPSEAGTMDDESPVSQAISYIEQHLFSDLTVGTAAAAVNLSYAHFCRLFKRQTGYSPKEYIVIKRIGQAKYLLHTTRRSVKEIAFSVGYNSEANFISSFVSKVGLSPGAFRKNPF